jgi:hypothetical protein
MDVLVQVRLPESPPLALVQWPVSPTPARIEHDSENAAFQFSFQEDTGRLGPARLRVRVTAPDFEINGESEKTLLVPPAADSPLLSFLLTPRRAGRRRINIELFDLAGTQIGNIFIATAVDETAPTELAPTELASSASLRLNVQIGDAFAASLAKHETAANGEARKRWTAAESPLEEVASSGIRFEGGAGEKGRPRLARAGPIGNRWGKTAVPPPVSRCHRGLRWFGLLAVLLAAFVCVGQMARMWLPPNRSPPNRSAEEGLERDLAGEHAAP